MPGPNVGKANLVKTIPSSIGCTLSLRNNNTRMISARMPAKIDCSAAKTITLAPVGGVGSKLLFKGGSK
jgi:hypothetical protein